MSLKEISINAQKGKPRLNQNRLDNIIGNKKQQNAKKKTVICPGVGWLTG
jgi:hypothetical protein